jgi:hypothetical protein
VCAGCPGCWIGAGRGTGRKCWAEATHGHGEAQLAACALAIQRDGASSSIAQAANSGLVPECGPLSAWRLARWRASRPRCRSGPGAQLGAGLGQEARAGARTAPSCFRRIGGRAPTAPGLQARSVALRSTKGRPPLNDHTNLAVQRVTSVVGESCAGTAPAAAVRRLHRLVQGLYRARSSQTATLVAPQLCQLRTMPRGQGERPRRPRRPAQQPAHRTLAAAAAPATAAPRPAPPAQALARVTRSMCRPSG